MATSKFLVDAILTVRVADVPVTVELDEPEFLNRVAEALSNVLQERLVLLDIKGSRSCADGAVVSLGVMHVTDWNQK